MTKIHLNLYIIFLIIIVILLDQISKWIVIQSLSENSALYVLPILNIVLVYNPGAAFGFLADAGGWQNGFFIVVTLLILVAIFYFLIKAKKENRNIEMIAIILIFAGAIGNLIDRIFKGKVVDFIDFHWHQYHYPAFNVADSAICIGVFLMIFSILFIPNISKSE